MYKNLLSPGKIGNLELKNKVVMTAMGVGAAGNDGTANKRVSDYYEERAKGGVGLIITEVTRINGAHGVAIPGQLGVNSDAHIEPLSKMVDRVHKHGTKFIPGNKLVNIDKDRIELEDKKGKKTTVDADFVVLSLGVRSVNDLVPELSKVCKKVRVIGDASAPGRILGATREGFKAAIEM